MSSAILKSIAQKSRPNASRALNETLKAGIAGNPDIQIVLTIAARAREIESSQPAQSIGVATDIVTVPTNSQCPV